MTALIDFLSAAAEVATNLSDALALPPPPEPSDDRSPHSRRWREQSLSKGAAGVAVLHGARWQDGRGTSDRVRAWLHRATREELSAGPKAGLWFGAPALAFAVHAAAPSSYPTALQSLDAAVTRLVNKRLKAAHARIAAAARPPLAEFDVVRGLTGLGAYLLQADPRGDRLRRVLSYLVKLTEPVAADDEAGPTAPGWWSADAASATQDVDGAGHGNFGMAHGIAGPLALLALAQQQRITVDGHTAAIERICAWLDAWRHHTPAGPWWPERISVTELRAGRSARSGPARPSWCYGTPGLARAQQLAGLALRDRARQHMAEHALARCLADPDQLARITDPAMCHGWAGLATTAWCAAADAISPDLGEQLPHLLATLLHHAHDPLPDDMPGLIDGKAGIALTLHSIAVGTPQSWPACLLLT